MDGIYMVSCDPAAKKVPLIDGIVMPLKYSGYDLA
jgi:hypothetical protein